MRRALGTKATTQINKALQRPTVAEPEAKGERGHAHILVSHRTGSCYCFFSHFFAILLFFDQRSDRPSLLILQFLEVLTQVGLFAAAFVFPSKDCRANPLATLHRMNL